MWFNNFIVQDKIIESADKIQNKIEPVDLPKKENFELENNEVQFKRETETLDSFKGKLKGVLNFVEPGQNLVIRSQ